MLDEGLEYDTWPVVGVVGLWKFKNLEKSEIKF